MTVREGSVELAATGPSAGAAARAWLTQAAAVFAKDWRVELRTRHALHTLLLFAVTTLITVSLTLGPAGVSSTERTASFFAIAFRILVSARYSSWRMRSRVTWNFFPTSSSVSSSRPSSPKRSLMISASRLSREFTMALKSALRFFSRSPSNGLTALSSPTISPNVAESPSSPMGASSEAGRTLTDFKWATFDVGI